MSDLTYLSKLLERAALQQFVSHLTLHHLMEPIQSVDRQDHSMETTLIKVKADLLRAIDNKEVACLVPLDFSAAFDMIDHAILL